VCDCVFSPHFSSEIYSIWISLLCVVEASCASNSHSSNVSYAEILLPHIIRLGLGFSIARSVWIRVTLLD
jgi:hypothetical protein